jgi:glycosyltransferase involved in cell wall biosynthesis
LRTLLVANAPWAGTGYGAQTNLLANKLHEAGHEVGVLAFYGLHGAALNWNGYIIYPGGAHPYGNDVFLPRVTQHFQGDLRAGLVITLIDVWVLDPAALSQTNVACWTPVDHEPVPPNVARVLEASQAWPVAMSKFGERTLGQAGFAPFYCPHAIDTQVFRPPEDRQALRRQHNLGESAFIVGMVAANKGFPPRKGFPEAIAAFARFADNHDDAFLVLHTEPNGVVDGVPIPAILQHYRIPPERVSLSNPTDYTLAATPEFMADMYGTFDVLLNPAYGEGFGIPILEAAACGVPAIVTDWTAMPEVGDVGWKVGGQELWTQQRSMQMIPSIDGLVAALTGAHRQADRMRDLARQHALQYDIETVFEDHWVPVLAELEQRAGLAERELVAA